MRNRAAALAATLLLGLGAPARMASAGATVDLLFVGQNGAPIAATSEVWARAGDLLTMAVVMRNDEPLTGIFFSLDYDLGGDELDVVSALEWRGIAIAASGAYFQPEENLESGWRVVRIFGGMAVGTWPRPPLPPASGAFAGGYQMGTVIWKVKPGVDTDAADMSSRLDLLLGLESIHSAFHSASASVNAAVPEPGTAALLGVGLLGLCLASRRRPT